MQFWINHPSQDMPVTFRRWALFRFSEWLYSVGCYLRAKAMHYEAIALYGEDHDDDLPF